jgi:hypothetical protein
VRVTGAITISAKDASMSGTVQIQGLPFISENITNGYVVANIAMYDGFTLTAGYTHLSAVCQPGQTTLDLRKSGSGQALSPVSTSEIPGTTVNLFFEVTYATSAL